MSCNGWSVKSRASSSHQKGAVHELHSTSLPRLQLQLIFVNLSLFQHITLTIDSRLTFIYDHGYSGVSKASGNFKKKNILPKHFSPSFWIIFRMWANSTSLSGDETAENPCMDGRKDWKSMSKPLKNMPGTPNNQFFHGSLVKQPFPK